MTWPENVSEFDHELTIPFAKWEYDAIVAEAEEHGLHPALLVRVWCCPAIGNMAREYLRSVPTAGE